MGNSSGLMDHLIEGSTGGVFDRDMENISTVRTRVFLKENGSMAN